MATMVYESKTNFSAVFWPSDFEKFSALAATADGVGYLTTPGLLTIYSPTEPQLTFDLTGSFIKTDFPKQIVGTVSAIKVSNSDESVALDITGLKASLTDLANAGETIKNAVGSGPVEAATLAFLNLILAGSDTIVGSASQNDIFGLAGHDTLSGGKDEDFFYFFGPYMTSGDSDKITDFNNDELAIDHTVVGIGHTGLLKNKEFKLSANPGKAHIWEDPHNGKLYYDGNGKAAGGKIVIAQLANHHHVADVDAGHIFLF
jgi:Ca2+-binding RTX toxin-like protein